MWNRDGHLQPSTHARMQATRAVERKAAETHARKCPFIHQRSVREQVVQSVLWLMDADRKVRPLKELQGLIWRDGYAAGTLIGEYVLCV